LIKKRFTILFIFTVFFFLVLTDCKKKSMITNVLFITLDTTRYFEPGFDRQYFDKNIGIDNFVFYPNVFTPIPITLPSHFSMFYSMTPQEARLLYNGLVIKTVQKGLPEILRDRGFSTAAVISLGALRHTTGINRGFQTFRDRFPINIWYKTAEQVNREAIPILNTIKPPFFMWVHYSDPHAPYTIPPLREDLEFLLNEKPLKSIPLEKTNFVNLSLSCKKGLNILRFKIKGSQIEFEDGEFKIQIDNIEIFRGNMREFTIKNGKYDPKKNLLLLHDGAEIHIFASEAKNIRIRAKGHFLVSDEYKRRNYALELDYMTQHIKKLLLLAEKRGLFENTAIFIVSDHGEGLGEYRNHFGHLDYLNAVYTKIPLFVYIPGEKPKTHSRILTTLDLTPTILNLLDIKSPRKMQGSDLFTVRENRKVILVTPGKLQKKIGKYKKKEAVSIIDWPYQIILTPNLDGLKIYHLEDDPLALTPLNDQDIRGRYQNMIRKLMKIIKPAMKLDTIDNKSLEILRSLGYL